MERRKECAGLRIIENTLRSDCDGEELADVKGAVWIDVLPSCILQADLIEDIAEVLAAVDAHYTLEENIDVTSWKIERTGDRLEVTAHTFTDSDAPRNHPRHPNFFRNEHAEDVRPVNGWRS